MDDANKTEKSGPLCGIRVIEMAGLGPVPLAGLLLSQLGAEIVRVERAGDSARLMKLPSEVDIDRLGRTIIKIDLKSSGGKQLMLDLCGGADMLLEGFRPGVMERLELGPDDCHAVNPGLIYGRMTGFGQDGPLANRAGHDLTYLALTGVLDAIGPAGGKPVPPLNLVADYGGGTMFLITGVLAALIERSHSGRGQVVDAAMIDGVSNLASLFYSLGAGGMWQEKRGANLLDSGAPFYDTYETGDGKHIAVACLEPQFFADFAELLELPDHLASSQYDRSKWPEMRSVISEKLAGQSRDHWAKLFETSDACVAPILSFSEAPRHGHNEARKTFDAENGQRPSPAPRFSRTPSAPAKPGAKDKAEIAVTLSRFGISATKTRDLLSDGVIDFR